ncbi:hypothetical protein SEA_DATBOI_160 [Gordonia phage DatBoi]|nr:hypothetical protein SEA_DATBOI_160 [Gordonia phage DatBoi]
MYTLDMTLDEAREWRDELEACLDREQMLPSRREQLSWDLQDVNDRIDELEGGE